MLITSSKGNEYKCKFWTRDDLRFAFVKLYVKKRFLFWTYWHEVYSQCAGCPVKEEAYKLSCQDAARHFRMHIELYELGQEPLYICPEAWEI